MTNEFQPIINNQSILRAKTPSAMSTNTPKKRNKQESPGGVNTFNPFDINKMFKNEITIKVKKNKLGKNIQRNATSRDGTKRDSIGINRGVQNFENTQTKYIERNTNFNNLHDQKLRLEKINSDQNFQQFKKIYEGKIASPQKSNKFQDLGLTNTETQDLKSKLQKRTFKNKFKEKFDKFFEYTLQTSIDKGTMEKGTSSFEAIIPDDLEIDNINNEKECDIDPEITKTKKEFKEIKSLNNLQTKVNKTTQDKNNLIYKLDNIISSNCDFQKKFDDQKLINLKQDGTFSRESRKTSQNHHDNSKPHSRNTMNRNINIVDKVLTDEKLKLLMDDDNQDANAIDSPVSSSFTMEFEKEEKRLKGKEMSKSKSKCKNMELDQDQEKKNTQLTEDMFSENEDLEEEFLNECDRDGDINHHKTSIQVNHNQYDNFNSPQVKTSKILNSINDQQLNQNTSNGYTELFINNNDDDLAVKNLNLIIEQNDDVLPTRSKLSEIMRSVSPGVQSVANSKFLQSHSSGFGMSGQKSSGTSINFDRNALRNVDLQKINYNLSVHGIGTSISHSGKKYNVNVKLNESVEKGKNLLQNYKDKPGYHMNKSNQSTSVPIPKINTDKIHKFRNLNYNESMHQHKNNLLMDTDRSGYIMTSAYNRDKTD